MGGRRGAGRGASGEGVSGESSGHFASLFGGKVVMEYRIVIVKDGQRFWFDTTATMVEANDKAKRIASDGDHVLVERFESHGWPVYPSPPGPICR
jgi:hypothetical protein